MVVAAQSATVIGAGRELYGRSPIPHILRERLICGGEDVNDKGYVPVLELDSGERLTEAAVICQYIPDQRPRTPRDFARNARASASPHRGNRVPVTAPSH
jgi:Glutathione S-transferase, N-terminal domain